MKEDLITKDYIARIIKNPLSGPFPHIRNLGRNYSFLSALLNTIDYNLKPKINPPRPAIVIGSGYSLIEAMKDLMALKKELNADIICTVSQVWSLLYNDIIPDYVIAHDPNEPGARTFVSIDAYKKADPGVRRPIPMLITPASHPLAFTWPGFQIEYGTQMYIYQTKHAAFKREWIASDSIELVSVFLYGIQTDFKYALKEAILMGPGSTCQAALTATSLGYWPIYFVGNDLCHWKGMNRNRIILSDRSVSLEPSHIEENEQFFPGHCGFLVDLGLVNEKATILGYMALWPSMGFVEVVIDGVPGNLQVLPQIGIEALLRGERPVIMKEMIQRHIAEFMKEHYGLLKKKTGKNT